MQPIWRLALNTLAGKPLRTALMIGAVALAASLITAIACAMATMQASMSHGITLFIGATDARIIHQGNERFEQSLLERAKSWPEVHAATGRLAASITLIREDRARHETTNELLRVTPTAIGVDFAMEEQFRIRELIAGALPTSKEHAFIDTITAEKLRVGVGDVLEVQRFGDPIFLTISGIFERRRLGAVQRPLIEIELSVLAEATDRPDELTSIVMILNEDVDVEAFCRAHQPELPEILVLEPAELVRSGFDRQMQASQLGLMIGSILAFISASFIVVTALTTSVTERQREMAVTRCIGASRGQLFASQIVAGLVLSTTGAFIGIPLGIALTAALAWWFAEFLPAGLHVHPLGLQLAIVGSLASGALGAVYPAFIASRVSPLQAMSMRARPPRVASIVWCVLLGIALIAVQLVLLQFGDPSTRFLTYAYAGLPSLLMGYFVLAVPVLIVVVLVLSGVVSRVLALPKGMLRRSMLVMPFRQGLTAGALMVGISMLVSSWANMQSLLNDWLGPIKFADGFAHRMSGISEREQQAIAGLPFVTDSCAISYMPLRVFDRQIFGVRGLAPPNVVCMGFDPDVFFSINAIEWVAGDPATAIPRLKDGVGLIVADRFLTTQRVKIGDTLTLGVGKVQRDFEIVGAVNSAGLDIAVQAFGIRSQYMEYSISCVFMDESVVKETFDNHDVLVMQLNLADGVSDDEVQARISEVAPGVDFNSGRWIVERIDEISTALLTVQSTVAFAALALACLGVGNVILANIYGRRYEYGVLRAVGAPKSLLARVIFAEALLLAIAGSVVGTALGMHAAWMGVQHYRDLAGLPVRLVLPLTPTAIGWLAVIVLTLIAALPGVLSVVRRQPSALLAGGRNG